MREKLETLSLEQLKELAKAEGIKGISTMKKADLVELLVKHADEMAKTETKPAAEAEAKSEAKPVAKTEVKAETKAEAKPAAKAEVKAETKAEAKPAAKAETRVETKPEPKSEAKNEPKAEENAAPRKMPEKKPEADKNAKSPENEKNDRNRVDRRNRNGNGKQSTQAKPNPQEKQNSQAKQTPQVKQNNRVNPNKQNNQSSQNNQNNQTIQSNRNNQNNQNNRNNQNNQNSQNNQNRQNRDAANQQVRQNTSAADPEGVKVSELDSGETASGILEIMQDGFGFIRSDNFLPGEDDVYVAPSQIRRFDLRTGDVITGSKRVRSAAEKFAALLYVKTINGQPADGMPKRRKFENLTPIFPNKRIHLDTGMDTTVAVRIVDLISPIGKGQRGMIVSPPKAGKTTLLKQIAKAVKKNEPDMHIIILLIDERPEEVTDMKEEVEGPSVEVIYSTFDEQPEQHKRVSEMVIERAKRLVEQGQDVMILLDSITRLARAYNLTVTPSGRTLSGGLDPAALYMPKRFFGAARNLREGGSLTILATALIDTGSRLDDMVFEEFKGTGNMELVLDRKLSERRIFPAIDILKSGTRRDDLLLSVQEQDASNIIHKMIGGSKPEETAEVILDLFYKTRTNREFIERLRMYRR